MYYIPQPSRYVIIPYNGRCSPRICLTFKPNIQDIPAYLRDQDIPTYLSS